MKLPTKAQWDKMAEAFWRSLKERGRKQLNLTTVHSVDVNSREGICWALDVGLECNFEFLYNIAPFRDRKDRGAYWWPLDDVGDRERAFFCMLMAAITEAGDMESLVGEA